MKVNILYNCSSLIKPMDISNKLKSLIKYNNHGTTEVSISILETTQDCITGVCINIASSNLNACNQRNETNRSLEK